MGAVESVEEVGLGFEGTETVAKPRAGLDAGFFFFLLFGGMVGDESPEQTGYKSEGRKAEGK